MLTIKEIAKLAGVSRGTVDRVLNGRPGVKPETEEQIRAIMEERGYRPNVAGKMLAARKRKLRLAFLVVYGPQFVFFMDVLHAARDKAAELRELGVTVDFYLIRQFDGPYLTRTLREVEESAPDGIAALPLRTRPFVEFMERMAAKEVPTVFFNIDEDFAPRLCYVGCDYVRSGRVAAGLCSLCAQNGGEVGVATFEDTNSASFTARMGGFVAEMERYAPRLKLANGGSPAIFHSGDASAVKKLLDEHPLLKVLYIVNQGDFSICRTVRKLAKERDLAIITNDLIPAQREMLKDGSISATISQRPDLQGSLPLQYLYDFLVMGETPPKSEHFTDLDIHISQNV